MPGQLFASDLRVIALLTEGDLSADHLVSSVGDGRRRVLTVLAPDLTASAEDAREFLGKASIGAAVGGDRLIPVLAAGVHEGRPWTVSDSLDGEPLSTRLATRGAMAWEEAAEAVWAIGEGLAPLHDRGLGHGALDPSTVFLEASMRGPEARARLRLSRVGVGRLLRQARLAQHDAGVPVDLDALRWTAPEQWRGTRHARPAADVWALGLLAFEMLVGRAFWDADAPPYPGGWAAGAWPSASERAEAVGAADLLPMGFDGWFARCTRDDEAGRYPDAVAAVTGLLDLLGRGDGPARRSAPPPPLASISPRKPLRDAAAAGPDPVGPEAELARASVPPGETAEAFAAPAPLTPRPPPEDALFARDTSRPPSDLPAPSLTPPPAPPADDATPPAPPPPLPDAPGVHPASDPPAPASDAQDEDEAPNEEDPSAPRAPRSDRPPAWRRRTRELSPAAARQRRLWLSLGMCTALMLWAATIVTSAKLYPEWLVPWREDSEGTHLPPSYELRWPDGTTRRWRGRWDAGELAFDVEYELSRHGETVRGQVTYTVEAPSPARPSLRRGARLDERVRGHFTADDSLVLEGRQPSRPAAFGAVTHELTIDAAGALDGDASQRDGTRARISAAPVR